MHSADILNLTSAIVPSRIATIFEGQSLSYLQLSERSCRLATAMHRMGVISGDRIAVVDVNSTQQLEVYFATMLLNAIFVPLNFRAGSGELVHPLQSTTPKLIFSGLRYSRMLMEISVKLPKFKLITFNPSKQKDVLHYETLLIQDQPPVVLPTIDENNDNDSAVLLFTAGTTGKPKAVTLTHHSFTSFMLSIAEPADPEVEEKNLLSLPLYHIAGLQSALVSVYSGRTIVIQKQFEAREWLEIVDKEKIQRALLVPTMLKQILEHPDRSSYDLSTIELITYGGAPMPISVLQLAISEIPNASFINAFGQTETGSTITAVPPEDHILNGPKALVEKRLKRLTSIGKALPDVDVRIIDENEEELPIGTMGEIAARGARVMLGYWGEEPNSSKWLRTGDLGYMDEDGYIYLQGREKDFIKRGGEMVSPEEVEAILYSYPGVNEAAIVGLQDDTWGERVVAVIVANSGSGVTDESLLEYVQDKLARFKRPEKIVFVDALPRNDLGKVLKRELRSWLETSNEQVKS